MPNNSSTGGYLLPAASPAPLEDDALADFLHDVFVGLTGLDGSLVRPRWQEEPPNQPARNVDWLAFGVQSLDADTYAYTLHQPGLTLDDGSDQEQRHEDIEILLSTYGPNSMKYMSIIRDGLQIEQNRSVLTAAGMGMKNSTRIIPAPELVKDQWLRRYDMSLYIRRAILREYPILNLKSALGVLNTEVIQTPLIVVEN